MCARRGMVAQIWLTLFLGVGDSGFHGKGLVLGLVVIALAQNVRF